MNAEGMAHAVKADEPAHTANASLWSGIPPFAFAPPPLDRGAGTAWPPLAALGAWSVLAALLLVQAGRRLRP